MFLYLYWVRDYSEHDCYYSEFERTGCHQRLLITTCSLKFYYETFDIFTNNNNDYDENKDSKKIIAYSFAR